MFKKTSHEGVCLSRNFPFSKVFITAEAGSNHNGDLETALELVYRAKEAGADAVKFQDFTLNSLFSPSHYENALDLKNGSWRQRITNCAFRPEWHERINDAAEKTGIYYYSTPLNTEAVDILDQYVPFYKVSSGDITHITLLEKIGSKGKGVFISTGASRLDEIDRAVRILTGYNLPFVCIMHCIMLYPPPLSSLYLNFIETLKRRYSLPVGYSDHTPGVDAPLLALGKGISALEKHFTLDKEGSTDHRISLDPEEMKRLVEKVRLYEKMLGDGERGITELEYRERIFARRGIYAGADLKKGEIASVDKLRFLRPKTAIGAEEVWDIAGKTLVQDVPSGTALDYSMFQ